MGSFFIDFINLLIKALGSVLSLVCLALPNSPFVALNNTAIAPYLTGLNYFVPIQEMLDVGLAWLTAIGIYYVYQIVLRWIKAVE